MDYADAPASTSTAIGARRVVFSERTVIKYQDVERTRVELMKTQLGAEIGRATALFRTPRIVSNDLTAGSITFERLHGFSNLQRALTTCPRPDRLVERVGQTLAAIHNQLSLPYEYVIPLPDFGVHLQTQPVFIHGDFSTGNIFYNAQRDELVVIDWSATDWLADGTGTKGPRYVDLAILLQSLFMSRLFAVHSIPDPVPLGQIFLEVYWQENFHELRRDEFQIYFCALLSVFCKAWRKQKGWRSVAYKSSFSQMQQFVRKFCLAAASVP